MVSGGKLDGLDGDAIELLEKGHSSVASTTVLEDYEGELPTAISDLDYLLRVPTDRRLYVIQTALENGYTVDRIYELTKIDKWFLHKLNNIARLKAETQKKGLLDLSKESMLVLKRAGFSDNQIARYTRSSSEREVREFRHQLGVFPFRMQIDTLAAEYPAQTNYNYLTYSASQHDMPSGACCPSRGTGSGTAVVSDMVCDSEELGASGVMVLGCGAYSIGSEIIDRFIIRNVIL